MNLFIEFSLAIVLLFASAFFSGAETALVSLSTTKAKRLALKNPHISQALLSWLYKPQELLIVILVGNTLTVVLFAALMTTAAVSVFSHFPASNVGFVAWIVQTIVLVILAEMAPKFFARTNAEKISLAVLPWLSRLRRWFRPVLILLTIIIDKVTPRTSIRTSKESLRFSLEELKLMLEEGTAPSANQRESISMMQGVLKIQDSRVESVMTPIENVDWVDLHPPGQPPRDPEVVFDLIVEQGHTRTPIKWKGTFMGFIHTDDLLPLVLGDQPFDLPDKIRKAIEVSTEFKVSDLLQPFRQTGIQMAFVKNAKEKIIGIVTLEDVLEEITGEILDEYDLSDLAQGQNK